MRERDLPLGRLESATLEFKSAAVLRSPFAVAREVAGFLNAGADAEVWIGLAETDGRANLVEPIAEPERARRDLWDHLVQTIEPAITHDEVEIHVVRVSDSSHVLCVEILPSRRSTAFAALREGGRFFMMRVGARLRPMTRDEIERAGSISRKTNAGTELALEWLIQRRAAVLAEPEPRYWLAIQPSAQQEFQGFEFSDEDRSLLKDPVKSGNRRSGWCYASPRSELVEEGGRLVLGPYDLRRTTLHHDGKLETTAQLPYFDHASKPTNVIEPLAFLEYTISFFRVASRLAILKSSETWFVDVVLTVDRGWKLPAYPSDTMGSLMEHEAPRELKALALPEPLRFEGQDAREGPDRVGFRIVQIVYQFMGLPQERIPRQYDRKAERLILSD